MIDQTIQALHPFEKPPAQAGGFFSFTMEKIYRVYVLENSDKKRYIGLSENVAIRLEQHNNGDSRWTAKHRPWHVIWTGEPMTLTDARKLENELKRAKGGNGFYEMTGLSRR